MAVRQGAIGAICVLCLLDVMNMTVYHRNICVREKAYMRPYGYFTMRTSEYESCISICQYIQEKGFKNLGMFQGGDNYEYPYWAILKDSVERIEHVNVYDESAVYSDVAYQPECIIWQQALPGETFQWNGCTYELAYTAEEGRYVFVKEELL